MASSTTINSINCQMPPPPPPPHPPRAKDAGTMTQSPLNPNPSPLSSMMPIREPESPATMTTNFTICHSIKSDVSLVKDPEFWRRFSVAIHQDEEQAKEPEHDKKQSESWLARQRKKTRRSKLCGVLIALVIVLIACGAGIAIWLLTRNNWRRRNDMQKLQS